MSPATNAIVLYIFFWAIRINGCIRRGLQPLRRGQEWFFDVPVPAGFYTGQGKRLLREYWMRMMIPFAVDIPIATYIFLSRRWLWMNCLIAALAGLIHLNHCWSVNLAQRRARRLRVPLSPQPVSRLALSLTPRRLRDYRNPKLEWFLLLSSSFAFALIVRYCVTGPDHVHWRLAFGVPILLLYLQIGMLFVKRVILAWRAPIPLEQAAEHIQAREAARKHYLRLCDWHRVGIAGCLLFWPVKLTTSPQSMGRLMSGWFIFAMAISVVSFVWIEIRRQQLLNLAMRATPVKLPDLLDPSAIVKWPVCYQPSVPTLIVEGRRGYSLNFANALTQLGTVYAAGLVVLITLLHNPH